MKCMLAAALSASLILVQAAPAQERTLQIDVNNLAFQARNALGAPAPFAGLTHTGSLHMTFQAPQSEIVGVLMKTGAGPFVLQGGFTGSLTSALVHIDLSGGAVTGGSMMFEIDGGPGSGGDRYSADIGAAGSVATFVGGGFQIDGLTNSGMFNDANWGGVDIADFFASQGGQFLVGSFLSFRIQPDGQGAGFADIDVFVSNIPAPGALLCLTAGGLVAMRRRR